MWLKKILPCIALHLSRSASVFSGYFSPWTEAHLLAFGISAWSVRQRGVSLPMFKSVHDYQLWLYVQLPEIIMNSKRRWTVHPFCQLWQNQQCMTSQPHPHPQTNNSPSGSGWDPRELTWKGRKGLLSKLGTSTLSSDDMVTSGWDSEMEDRNWSMSAFCSWSSSSRGPGNKGEQEEVRQREGGRERETEGEKGGEWERARSLSWADLT